MEQIGTLIVVAIAMVAVFGAISVASRIYNLNSIKSKTVGDGQHGTARWARKDEISNPTYIERRFTINTLDMIHTFHHYTIVKNRSTQLHIRNYAKILYFHNYHKVQW